MMGKSKRPSVIFMITGPCPHVGGNIGNLERAASHDRLRQRASVKVAAPIRCSAKSTT